MRRKLAEDGECSSFWISRRGYRWQFLAATAASSLPSSRHNIALLRRAKRTVALPVPQPIPSMRPSAAIPESVSASSTGGLYLNFPCFAEEGGEMLHAAYGDTYARLQAVKSKYDPINLFRTNFNIAPLANAEG
jgi:hypothetical protein